MEEYILCTKEQYQDFEREHLIWAKPIGFGFEPLYFDGKQLIWLH